ncbi:MAG: bacillithiol biosynthesis cysteine-adding enzyme BshC [Bacteroidota bacterium]|nr:bacillithiol biosynthesis cysteine-adding enzyme BshC [Bacteroidota bacterium]
MPYQSHHIPLSETGSFSRLILDYIDQKKNLQPFYTFQPEISSFKQAMKDRTAIPLNRELLVDVLKKQYAAVPSAEPSLNKIHQLSESGTFTVCTGHQLCLFTGPLYFIYKILSVINLSEALKKQYPENNFVPVYWMASEDHDFEEISTINLFGKKIKWETDKQGGPVGRMDPLSIEPVLDEYKTLLGDSAFAIELDSLFRDAYLKHSTLAEATRFLVHSLFGKYGLVILDGDDPSLKEEFKELIIDDIRNQTNFSLVNESSKALKQEGYDIQVNPREINVFRMTSVERRRIENSSEEILNLPVQEFSPNVVLRPLYQQRILPNLAYVGGPGELAYWLEYKAMFDHHRILFPVLIPRNFAMIVDQKSAKQLAKLGMNFTELFSETDELIKRFINNNSSGSTSLTEEADLMKAMFEGICKKAVQVDPTLKANAEAELQKSLQGLKNIETKLLRAEKQKQEHAINQIKKLKEKFFPENILQERYENFSPYYLSSGSLFIEEMKGLLKPFDFSMQIIVEKSPENN